MCDLTVIVPFLNEGVEVYNTIKSFKESTKEKFEMILINDGSDDGFYYERIAQEWGATYIKHTERKGVAASRDEGVVLCNTKYFLLLDAHMRVYQNNWIDRIIQELETEECTLLCCSTLRLKKEGDFYDNTSVGHGAFVDLLTLDLVWVRGENNNKDFGSLEIPCVLGASYACSKKYWMLLRGLSGLQSYGLDEQLISFKVWLNGGKCKVLMDVKFGHIFRNHEEVPYLGRVIDYYVNVLFVIELFYSKEYKIKIIEHLRKVVGHDFFNLCVEQFAQIRLETQKEKEYCRTIFKRNFDFLIQLNNNASYVVKKEYSNLYF